MKRRATVLATLALSTGLGLGTLSGCGAGAVTQTAQQSSAVNGYQGRAGDVAVRDASIVFAGQANSGAVYRAGQSAQLRMTLVNVGDQTDKLLTVSSPVAAAGQVLGDATIGGGRAVQVGNSDGQADAAALSDRTITVQLTGLKQDITPGLNYPVTLTFQRGGVLNTDLPVGYPTGPLSSRSASN
ncbi:MAG TPA: copper chaperone PCu(A)C [Pseudonocardia sp.]